MTGGEVVASATASLAAASVCVAALTAAGLRVVRSRRADAEAAVRPVLFSAIDTGRVDEAALDALSPLEHRALQAQARSLLPQLRGQDQDNLARLLEHSGAVRAARRQLRSPRPAARARASRLLGDAGCPADLADLVRLLDDPNPGVRWSAARSLGRLGNPEAVAPLLASLEGPRPIPPDVVVQAVSEIRGCPVAVLRQGLRSRSAPIRAVSVELLGRFQALAAGPDVIRLLSEDPSVQVRARAAQSLGRLGSRRGVDALLACLADGPPAMHPQAVWALGEIGAPEAVPALRSALMSPSRQVRAAAAHALRAVRAPGAPAAGPIGSSLPSTG